MTSKKLGIALLSLVVLAIFAVAPVAAAPVLAVNITAGDTVFIGESGLNISAPLDGNYTIAWYAAGSSPKQGDAPKKVVTLTEDAVKHFYVDEGTFGDYTGTWYVYNATENSAKLAFYVDQPSLSMKVFRSDKTTSVDGKKAIADDLLVVRIDSTFSTLFQRANTTANFNATDFVIYGYNATGFTINDDLELIANGTQPYPEVVRGEDRINAAIKYLKDTYAFLDSEIYKVPAYKGEAVGINGYLITPNNAKLTASIVVPWTNNEVEDWPWENYAQNDIESMSLQAIAPTRADYYLYGGNPVWSAGRVVDEREELGHKILSGEYQFYADININGMKDNLGEISGKTRSNTATVTIDKETVTITADKSTVIRNNGFSVKVEGKPKTEYVVWFTGANGYNSDEVPAFIQSQQDVKGVTYVNASYAPYKTSGARIVNDLPKDVTIANGLTSNYAVIAKTNAAGAINLGIITNEDTKDTTFTIRAQRLLGYGVRIGTTYYPTGLDLDMQLYDTVKVKVEKGAVTVSASGDGSYYLGEEVTLSGTNTDSDEIFLFITGPNLPVNGGVLEDPKTAPDEPAEKYTRVNVKTDDTWEYKWDTSGSILDAGTYTIYATSDFATKDTLSDIEYDTVSVVIKKPFVTATTSASTVAKGDKLYIRGTAEGNPTQGVAIWILGKNYWNGEDKKDISKSKKVTETVNDDGSFEYELGSGDTKDLASGQYFVVVQHPMYNGIFDVDSANSPYNENVIQVYTDPQYSGVEGVAFIIAGAGKLQGSDAAEALIQSINSANVDDTYTKLTFLVEEPWIRVNSVGDHYIGDQFKITGTTNLAIGDNLIVEVTSSSFQPTQKTQSGEFSGVSSTVKVTEGSSYNEWALDVDASTFKADEYIVNVEAIEADCTTTTTFNILTGSATVAPTSAPTAAPTSAPTSAPTTAPTPAATASPGFGALVALIGLGAVAALIIRKD